MDDAWLTSRSVREWLGIGRHTLAALLKAGTFPNATRPGRAWRIPVSDVLRLLGSNGIAEQCPLVGTGKAAHLAGVSLTTIHLWRNGGRIPGVKVGHDWRYPIESLRRAAVESSHRRRGSLGSRSVAAPDEQIEARWAELASHYDDCLELPDEEPLGLLHDEARPQSHMDDFIGHPVLEYLREHPPKHVHGFMKRSIEEHAIRYLHSENAMRKDAGVSMLPPLPESVIERGRAIERWHSDRRAKRREAAKGNGPKLYSTIELADKFGVSRQRVHQIAKARRIEPYAERTRTPRQSCVDEGFLWSEEQIELLRPDRTNKGGRPRRICAH